MKSKKAQLLCLVSLIFTTIFLTLIFTFVKGALVLIFAHMVANVARNVMMQ